MNNIDLLWDDFREHFAFKKEEYIKIADFCNRNCKEMRNIILQTADELTENRFLFRLPWDMETTNEPVNFGVKINWNYCFNEDEEFIFQLNRHRYLICLGQAFWIKQNDIYVITFINQLLDWINENIDIENADRKVWRTLETGLRADYWVRAMSFFTSHPLITDEIKEKFFLALSVHANHLATNPKEGFSIKSNWGVMEYAGLYVLSHVLKNDEYKKKAIYFLKMALHTQIHDDGMQWEASTMYHNEVLDAYFEVLRVAKLYNDEVFSEDEKNIIKNMAFATLYHTYPNHHQILTGDSDDTDVRDLLSRGALLFKDRSLKFAGYNELDFESAWLFGTEGIVFYEKLESKRLSGGLIVCHESGEAIWRDSYNENSDFIYFRNGSLGGGHGHQDKLHMELWFEGEEILRDSGRFTYKNVDERYRLKESQAHNVPIINNSEYAECMDSWIYKNLPPSTGNTFVFKENRLLFEGFHCGYIDLNVILRRRIVAPTSDIIIISDEIIGNKRNELSQHFAFGKNISLKKENNVIIGQGERCEFSVMCFDERGELLPEITNSLLSRHYNQIEETSALKVNTSSSYFLTTVIVKNRENQKIEIVKEDVYNFAYEVMLSKDIAQGYVITRNKEKYGVVLIKNDVGNYSDLNGIRGVYGLGQTMVCVFHKNPEYMTVLRW
ncbi:heparinase [Lachnoanaerobaculum gingivalis]|uniref:Heparinase n=1 Tax=Lachnoanaerobaculum gingivalis TaxID=2490855 RepID=A0A3P3QW02_9FIRM|nr:heparinase II/III family protein [Lachnoanaerobaculum gingivalis]RRJ25285.1 heparinase [Lachnoanaerobaculum gingivalis]